MTSPGIQSDDIRRTFSSGQSYIELGWSVFLLARDDDGGKIPFKNCGRCDVSSGTCRGGNGCTCSSLTCHGFYAATSSVVRWVLLVGAAPGGYLAVRTGSKSSLLVLDFEADGLATLDHWEEFTEGRAGSLPRTATARTQGAGIHLFYRIPTDRVAPPSGNRILPGMDVKCEGGYVAVPGGLNERRVWTRPPGDGVAEAPGPLLDWLATRGPRRSRRSDDSGDPGYASTGAGRPNGYEYGRWLLEGPPDGQRDYFFNDMCFRLRRRGCSKYEAMDLVHQVWELAAQPPVARWFMPWSHVVYKIDRVWNEVDVEAPLDDRLHALVRRWNEEEPNNTANPRRVKLMRPDGDR